MGAYIHIGLVTKISFSKKDSDKINNIFSNIDDFKSVLEKDTNLSMQYFEVNEIDGAYSFEVQKTLLEPSPLANFLADFFEFYYFGEPKLFEYAQNEIIAPVAALTSVDDLFGYTHDDKGNYFRAFKRESYLHHRKLPEIYIERFKFDYLLIEHHGKAWLETYEPFFSYIERLIRLKHSQSQANLVKLFLDE